MPYRGTYHPSAQTPRSATTSLSYATYASDWDRIIASAGANHPTRTSGTAAKRTSRFHFRTASKRAFTTARKAIRAAYTHACAATNGGRPTSYTTPKGQSFVVRRAGTGKSRRSARMTPPEIGRLRAGPRVCVTQPSQNGAVRYSVHLGPEAVSTVLPPSSRGKSHRFSHPVVDGVIPGREPLASAHPSLASQPSLQTIVSVASVSSWETVGSSTPALPVPAVPAQTKLSAKTLYNASNRQSGEGVKAFLARMDGIGVKPVPASTSAPPVPPISAAPPALPYVAYTPPTTVDDFNGTDFAAFCQNLQAQSVQAGTAAPVVVVAQLPASLQPGATASRPAAPTQPRATGARPHTIASAPTTSAPVSIPYVAYSAPFNPYGAPQHETTVSPAPKPSQLTPPPHSTATLAAAISEAQEAEDRAFSARHAAHVAKHESALFNSPIAATFAAAGYTGLSGVAKQAPAPAVGEVVRKARQVIRRKPVPVPAAAAAAACAPRPPPATPSPLAPRPRATAADVNKPLPASPGPVSPRRFTRYFAPAPQIATRPAPQGEASGGGANPGSLRMRGSNFPFLDAGAAAKSAVAEPTYQRRSVNAVEAKYQQARAAKAEEKKGKGKAPEGFF